MDVREVSAEDVELEYVSATGVRERGSLGRLWPVRFESVRPERRFPAFRGQGNWCGWYWSATCGGHVGYESWLERDRLMLLDFDPLVTGMASQPFRLSWAGAGRKRVRHTPDFFVRRADGTGLVVDVRPDERIEPDDARTFAVTAVVCRAVGWDFQRVGTPEAVLMANVRWLAGYRHPRVHRPEVAARLVEVFADCGDLLAGARRVGDRIAVLPALFHLLWRRVLAVDLEAGLLSAHSRVRLGMAGEGGGDAVASAAAASG
ncbi:TnsA-like heteromeric transposase endonuclease subunit [Streptomyces olivoreticuli]|uniref:TnsA-like heteromeric transposase endonuclease subunit n=1 Tax=Streptomyces olivoreticuli TaxID=68246 RepID=UPI002658102E|nr:TnsA-like heteromeric transposase endonuclease subunit [Streptomyces olivoreticuli]WKK24114.1 TnsA-like heteromeric transposase endonuclease subunit [Streptomyces olivoreticuli]